MTKFKLVEYQNEYFDRWNNFVKKANGGTIFHRLDFLSYHGLKFKENERHLMFLKGKEIFGVMPMAVFENGNKKIARSPYGASYGGPVFIKPLHYTDSIGIVKLICEYVESYDIDDLLITFPIMPCYEIYSDTFRFALMEQGFQCINRDVSNVVYIGVEKILEQMFESRTRNMVRKAHKAGIKVKHKADFNDFWNVLEKTFAKHGVKPTHAKEELLWLGDKISEEIYFDVAYLEGSPIGGIAFFVVNSIVNSTFYLAQDLEYQKYQGLSLLIYEAIMRGQKKGYCWFDFGTSSSNMQGRENIFKFKESFGAVGYFRETYEWSSLKK